MPAVRQPAQGNAEQRVEDAERGAVEEADVLVLEPKSRLRSSARIARIWRSTKLRM
jgi:hypothetical protein